MDSDMISLYRRRILNTQACMVFTKNTLYSPSDEVNEVRMFEDAISTGVVHQSL